jgi:hypothetical protein
MRTVVEERDFTIKVYEQNFGPIYLAPGWVETAFFPQDRYRARIKENGIHLFTYDEQQAALEEGKCPYCKDEEAHEQHDEPDPSCSICAALEEPDD